MQIQALIVGEVGEAGVEKDVIGSNMESQMKVAKPPVFNEEAERVGGFIIAYKLYLRIKMKEATVEEQVQ